MYISITLILFGLAAATMVGLRIWRQSTSYSWLASSLGGLLAWVSVLVWQLDLPRRFLPSIWTPNGLYNSSPVLLADSYAWLYAISLTALAAAVIITSPARASSTVNPAAWAGTLALTVLGLLAVLADNPLTLVLAWTAIDLAEFFNTLRASDSPSLSERTVVSFAIRAIGTGFALWASVVTARNGQTFVFENTGSEAGIFLLLAVGLRLGVLPLHLTYRSEPMLRRGFGTLLRLLAAATSLILLSRLPAEALDFSSSNWAPFLLIFVAMAAFYGSWQWFFASDELSGRPFWIIGMSALSMAAALRGSATGSAAWGAALVLFGGISFLYSARHPWFTRILAGLGILMLGLPFSLTAAGWSGSFIWPVLFWPVFMLSHFLLVAGYIRHIYKPGEALYRELPTWAQSSYPGGIALLVITVILASLWGWPGALQLGAWGAGAVMALLCLASAVVIWRFRPFLIAATSEQKTSNRPGVSRFSDLMDVLVRVFWAFYRLAGSIANLASNLLEGDGGLLWTLLLLVLFITIFRGN